MLYGGTAFNPLSITGLQFWVDASDYTTLYQDSALTTRAINDGDVIGGWSDKSGNGRNALQTDGTKKPLLKLAIQNGRNIIRFDGINDFLTWSNVFSDNPCTFFGALKSSWTARNCSLIIVFSYYTPLTRIPETTKISPGNLANIR